MIKISILMELAIRQILGHTRVLLMMAIFHARSISQGHKIRASWKHNTNEKVTQLMMDLESVVLTCEFETNNPQFDFLDAISGSDEG
jgi:hypothetical protein